MENKKPEEILEKFLKENYGSVVAIPSYIPDTKMYQSGNLKLITHISKDNIISIYKLQHRFGVEEYTI